MLGVISKYGVKVGKGIGGRKFWGGVVVSILALVFSSCQQILQQTVPAEGRYVYHFEAGKTLKLDGRHALVPKNAPREVKLAVAAANRLVNKPYRRGGGHRKFEDTGYDCSGAASYVLRNAGLLKGCLTSRSFRHYGERGEGEWIDIYHKNGHVFLVIGGLRFDTGSASSECGEGPRWRTASRRLNGFYIRHPEDF